MNHESPGTARRLELTENTTARLGHGRHPVLVRVERGTVLVTQAGDLDDHVLEPGDALVLPSGGLAVAWALTDAAIRVRTSAGDAWVERDGAAG